MGRYYLPESKAPKGADGEPELVTGRLYVDTVPATVDVEEPGDPTTPDATTPVEETPSTEEPAGNASTEAWVEYAKSQGATDEDLVDGDGNPLGRDALREKYGSKD